jgi:hypothetical protein
MAAPRIPNWQAQILHGIGAPVTPANVSFLNAWTRAEGGGAENNPFNTTQPGFGTVGNYNSVGVKRYATPAGGIDATVHTLLNGRYGNILGALKQGTDARAAAQALANSPWGTGALVLKILGSGGAVGAPPVGPSVGAPQAPPPQPRGSLGRPPLSPLAAQIIGENDQLIGIPAPNLSALTVQQPTQAAVTAAPPVARASAPRKTTAPYTAPKVKGSTLKFIEAYGRPFGLTITATTNGRHAKGSYHYRARAVDFAGPLNSDGYRKMAALANSALHHAGDWTELIYTGPGNPGYSILGGKVIPNSQLSRALYDEHTNHVHLAR